MSNQIKYKKRYKKEWSEMTCSERWAIAGESVAKRIGIIKEDPQVVAMAKYFKNQSMIKKKLKQKRHEIVSKILRMRTKGEA
jgi:hypothetical protein